MRKSTRDKGRGVVKGAPSGFVISMAIHAAAFALAGMLVVFNVVKKEEKKFVPPKPVDRPKMKLKKPKVKVKKTSKPRSTTRIVTKVQKASMPDIQLPEMTGMGEGLVGDIGGFEITPNLEEISVFGAGQAIGNDFEGELYHFRYDRRGGKISSMDLDPFFDIVREYARKGFKKSVLAPYYRSAKKLYTTHFIVPQVPSRMAPGLFGEPDKEGDCFFVNYKGKLVYHEDIKFRFWGSGDGYISVMVDGEHVLLNGWDARLEVLDYWQSSDSQSGKHYCVGMGMAVGDWIELKAGEPKDMEIFFGEWGGGIMSAALLVEVEGVEYPQTKWGGPLLPAFKTEEFTRDQLEEIYKFLPPGELSLTNGPVFRDY
ncbi:hypothetical protein EGM51_04795 [Verrucomicrobia bacterium S94]|nr:hypothetical protein EGM51_04795 [Verrucomicrobia bacterium S94]